MRCLFTMLAKDVGLLGRDMFTAMLRAAIDEPRGFAPMLEELWRAMEHGGYSTALRQQVRHFNGGLLADAAALPLERKEIGELHAAARHLWTDVETVDQRQSFAASTSASAQNRPSETVIQRQRSLYRTVDHGRKRPPETAVTQ